MEIVYPCQHCHHRITAPAQFAGREVRCPKCQRTVRLPGSVLDDDDLLPPSILLDVPRRTSSATAEHLVAKPQKVIVRCDQCFQQYIVPAASADHEFECPKCRHTFRVPAAALSAEHGAVVGGIDKLKSAMAVDTIKLGDELLAELGLLDQPANEGNRLYFESRGSGRLDKRLSRMFGGMMNFVEQHPLALVSIVVGMGASAAVLLYFFR